MQLPPDRCTTALRWLKRFRGCRAPCRRLERMWKKQGQRPVPQDTLGTAHWAQRASSGQKGKTELIATPVI